MENATNGQQLSDEETEPPVKQFKKENVLCPYLDTINRQVLDFDFEKLCSISLSRINVYACLVCGKYFQGRGNNTHAYTHSIAESHHVFLNLHTLKFYCLPDNYEIVDSSLDDIKYVLNPTFTKEQIKQLNTNVKMSRAIERVLHVAKRRGDGDEEARVALHAVDELEAAGVFHLPLH
jgi:U4/U6.U5 tri-snRNP-associated protein 2